MVVYITVLLLFANIDVMESCPRASRDYNTLLPSMDVFATQMPLHLLEEYRNCGVKIVICGLTSASMTMMSYADIVDLLGECAFYWSVECVRFDNSPVS